MIPLFSLTMFLNISFYVANCRSEFSKQKNLAGLYTLSLRLHWDRMQYTLCFCEQGTIRSEKIAEAISVIQCHTNMINVNLRT